MHEKKEGGVCSLTFAKTLKFPADEDGGQQVSGDEEQQENIVESGIAGRIEARQKRQSYRADKREEDAQRAEDLFTHRRVGHQKALVSEQAIGYEGRVEEDGRQNAAHDE
jgi:hypothetical protein